MRPDVPEAAKDWARGFQQNSTLAKADPATRRQIKKWLDQATEDLAAMKQWHRMGCSASPFAHEIPQSRGGD